MSLELQNLHCIERLERKPVRINPNYIEWLCTLGFYCVVEYVEVFGIWTDAFLGYDEVLTITRSGEEVEHISNESDCKVYYPEPPLDKK